jgi:hypothetical protein
MTCKTSGVRQSVKRETQSENVIPLDWYESLSRVPEAAVAEGTRLSRRRKGDQSFRNYIGFREKCMQFGC